MALLERIDTAAVRCASGWCAPIVAAIVVLMVVGAGTRTLCIQVDRTVESRTQAAVDDTVDHIDTRLQAIGTLLAALSAFEAGSQEVTAEEFTVFLSVASRDRALDDAFPGLGGVIVLDAADHDRLRIRHVANIPGWPQRSPTLLEDCASCMTVLADAAAVAGSIVSSTSLPPDTAAQLGGQLLLVDAFSDGPSDGSATPDTRADGWTVVAVDIDALVETTSLLPLPGPIGVDDDQGRSLQHPADDVTLHRRTLDVFGTSWTLHVPEPVGLRPLSERALPLLFLALGTVLAVVVGWLVRSLAGSRSRALDEVADATAELSRSNDQLAASNAQLQAANEELRTFSAVVAHDLKSPMTSIRGLAETVRDGRAVGDQATALLERIVVNVDRLTSMIDGVLEYAAAGRTIGEVQPVPLGPLVAEALDRLEARIATRDADIEVGDLPTVLGDPRRLTEVFQNLVSNAIVHAPHDRRPTVTIDGCRRGASVEVTVSDSGDGIPAEERDTVLLAFHRGANTEAGTGTGLGIPTAIRIITAHGGTLALEDTPGGGLRVRITLPAADD